MATSSKANICLGNDANKIAGAGISDEELLNRIEEEYRIWKKNAPFLYDTVITHCLEWPSLTVEWMPDKVKYGTSAVNSQCSSDLVAHKLLLGTHTADGDQNFLMHATVKLHQTDGDVNVLRYPGVYTPPTEASSNPGSATKLKNANMQQQMVSVSMRINHQGEVNRARYCPTQPFLLATKSVSGDVWIFDYSKFTSQPAPDGICRPTLTLKTENECEGFALEWCSFQKNLILSGGDDGLVSIWDVGDYATPSASVATRDHKNDTSIRPSYQLPHSTEGQAVGDISCHEEKSLICSVGDDKAIKMWDIRQAELSSATLTLQNAHKYDIMCCEFNPNSEYIMATSCKDIHLWDLRKMDSNVPLYTFDQHEQHIRCLRWAPFSEIILASGSADRTVRIWDLSRIGEEIPPEDTYDGPPELLFSHGGHCAAINDIAWSPNDPWLAASVSEDNMLIVWQMNDDIYLADTSEEGDKENIDGDSDSEGDANDVE